MDKIIIDTPMELWGSAMIVVTRVMAQFPDQKIGTSNAVTFPYENRDYAVVRNEDSYTITLMEEIPVDDLQQTNLV